MSHVLMLARFLHIAVAAAWFGHKLLIPFDLRQIISADRDEAIRSLTRIDLAENLGKVTGIGTLITGGWLVFLVGPIAVAPAIYAGLAFVLIAIGVGAVIARPAAAQFRTAIQTGQRGIATSSARKLSQVLVAESLLWTAALASMLL